eukprot:Clim_evm87s172 gene=Clim_evmTU87s172
MPNDRSKEWDSLVLNWFDDNIRYLQWFAYGLGVVGVGIFVRNSPATRTYNHSQLAEVTLGKLLRLRGSAVQFKLSGKSDTGNLTGTETITFKFLHQPHLKGRKATSIDKDALIRCQLAGISVTCAGRDRLAAISQKALILHPIRLDDKQNVFYSRLLAREGWVPWRRDVAILLLREGQAILKASSIRGFNRIQIPLSAYEKAELLAVKRSRGIWASTAGTVNTMVDSLWARMQSLFRR